jgi:hypothetical protein
MRAIGIPKAKAYLSLTVRWVSAFTGASNELVGVAFRIGTEVEVLLPVWAGAAIDVVLAVGAAPMSVVEELVLPCVLVGDEDDEDEEDEDEEELPEAPPLILN